MILVADLISGLFSLPLLECLRRVAITIVIIVYVDIDAVKRRVVAQSDHLPIRGVMARPPHLRVQLLGGGMIPPTFDRI